MVLSCFFVIFENHKMVKNSDLATLIQYNLQSQTLVIVQKTMFLEKYFQFWKKKRLKKKSEIFWKLRISELLFLWETLPVTANHEIRWIICIYLKICSESNKITLLLTAKREKVMKTHNFVTKIDRFVVFRVPVTIFNLVFWSPQTLSLSAMVESIELVLTLLNCRFLSD